MYLIKFDNKCYTKRYYQEKVLITTYVTNP